MWSAPGTTKPDPPGPLAAPPAKSVSWEYRTPLSVSGRPAPISTSISSLFSDHSITRSLTFTALAHDLHRYLAPGSAPLGTPPKAPVTSLLLTNPLHRTLLPEVSHSSLEILPNIPSPTPINNSGHQPDPHQLGHALSHKILRSHLSSHPPPPPVLISRPSLPIDASSPVHLSRLRLLCPTFRPLQSIRFLPPVHPRPLSTAHRPGTPPALPPRLCTSPQPRPPSPKPLPPGPTPRSSPVTAPRPRPPQAASLTPSCTPPARCSLS